MSTTSSPDRSSAPGLSGGGASGGGLRRDRLGVLGVAFFVIAAVAPMAAIVGASPVIFATSGPSAPLVYLLAGLLFVVFSVGYVAMSRHVRNAGGFVAYVARGLGARAGAAAAGITILCYVTLLGGLWSQFSVFAESLLANRLGLPLPRVLLLVVLLVVVSAITARGIDVSLRVLGVLLVIEVLTFVVLDIAILAQGGGGEGLSFDGFSAAQLLAPGLGVAFLFCVSSFTGFEATVVFAEEAKDPRRTIPRAAYLAIGFIGVFYAFTAWCLSNAAGPSSVQQEANDKLAAGTFVPDLAAQYLGGWFATLLDILVVTSFFAMLTAFHNLFARYVFALGRARFLPASMGRTTARNGTPALATVAIGVVVTVVLLGFEVAGADPIAVTYLWLLALGTAALLVVLFVTCIAVVLFFARERTTENALSTRVTPVISLLGFGTVLYLAIANYDVLSNSSTATWLLLAIPVAAVIGWVRASRRRLVDFSSDLS